MDGGVGQGCVVPVKADLSVEGKGAGGSCSRRASLACGNLRSAWILEGGADHPSLSAPLASRLFLPWRSPRTAPIP
ncbi:unnamed protein product [Ectocarpus sp. 6 AP-2014]